MLNRVSLRRAAWVVAVAAVIATPAADAQHLVVPIKGQSDSRQFQDEEACRKAAALSSGFDPAVHSPAHLAKLPAPIITSPAASAQPGSEVAPVAGDAVVNEDDPDGLVAKTISAAAARRAANQKAAKQQQKVTLRRQEDQAAYDKAYQACLEERGYVLR